MKQDYGGAEHGPHALASRSGIAYSYDANGNLLPNRIKPNQAGFGAVSGFQSPRTIQAQVRFMF